MNPLIDNIITILNTLGGGFCNYTGSMFVQSGILIVLLLFVDFLTRKRIRATLRYWMWMLVFVKLILPPSLSLPTGLGYWRGDILSAAPPALEETLTNTRHELSEPPLLIDETPLLFEIPQNQLPQTTAELTDSATPVISYMNTLTWQAVVFALWLVGVLVFSALLIQRILYVRRLIAWSEPVENRFAEMLNQCLEPVGIRRPIELRLSNNVFSPAVCGVFKPVILIPTALIEKLQPDRLRAVLIHELCHIKRGDLWINAAQTILQIIYFYNPLVWLANVVVRGIREEAVDEMALITLGARAKDYSNTLIDIAEIAFFKTSLSLRLIGVVESKKALNRRIGHMLNRPIPKNTKVGVVGTIAIMLIAAVSLPMARAQKKNADVAQAAQPNEKFTATLPNDVTVELLGVCEHPSEGRQWWRADGTILESDRAPSEHSHMTVDPDETEQARELALRFAGRGVEHMAFRWRMDMATRSSSHPFYVTEKREKLKPLRHIVFKLPRNLDAFDFSVGIATGEWENVATGDTGAGGTNDSMADRGVIWHRAYVGEDGSTITTVAHGLSEADTRVVAEGRSGKEHEAKGSRGGRSDDIVSYAYSFNVAMDEIKRFHLRARAYEWIEFKNVSLRPGSKTDVQVEVEKEKQTNSRPEQNQHPSSGKTLLQLIDSAQPGSTVIVPKGVYTQPIGINKSLTLKGESRTECILEVTTNEPVIFVDTQGKGKVIVQDLTIKWQLATSDKGIERPFALGVKDTKAEIKNCSFIPLGNFRRSPVAVRTDGFSELNISKCRFEGFEYVICYGEGTKGKTSDCLIMNCGHQGIINYTNSILTVERNVITGSKFHAIRCTGGTLHVKDNLLIKNDNRGIYLGNKSGSGSITNNLIIGNGTGIGAFARSKYEVKNNIITDSSYAGIGMEKSGFLTIEDNIFVNNERGWIMFDRGAEGGNSCRKNTFWKNKVDTENFNKTANSIEADPGFVDPANGDFSLESGPAQEHNQGLTNTRIFKTLWKVWQNRKDKNEPFASKIGQSSARSDKGADDSPIKKVDYSAVTVEEGIGFDDIAVGDPDCSKEFVRSKLGTPDEEMNRRLSYRQTFGLDFWLSNKGVLSEIRINPGFKGRLIRTGISLASSKRDVFVAHGYPIKEKQIDNLSGKNDHRILYKKGNISRI